MYRKRLHRKNYTGRSETKMIKEQMKENKVMEKQEEIIDGVRLRYKKTGWKKKKKKERRFREEEEED